MCRRISTTASNSLRRHALRTVSTAFGGTLGLRQNGKGYSFSMKPLLPLRFRPLATNPAAKYGLMDALGGLRAWPFMDDRNRSSPGFIKAAGCTQGLYYDGGTEKRIAPFFRTGFAAAVAGLCRGLWIELLFQAGPRRRNRL